MRSGPLLLARHALPALALPALAVAGLALSGCTRPRSPDAPPALRVEAAQARLVPSGVGAVYLRVANLGGEKDRLLAAESDAARAVELHEVVRDGVVLRMEPREDGFEVPPGGALELAPGGKHLMLLGLTVPAATDRMRLTLRFARAGPVEVEVPVRPFAEDQP
jgi:copper(I)-binding protein